MGNYDSRITQSDRRIAFEVIQACRIRHRHLQRQRLLNKWHLLNKFLEEQHWDPEDFNSWLSKYASVDPLSISELSECKDRCFLAEAIVRRIGGKLRYTWYGLTHRELFSDYFGDLVTDAINELREGGV